MLSALVASKDGGKTQNLCAAVFIITNKNKIKKLKLLAISKLQTEQPVNSITIAI